MPLFSAWTPFGMMSFSGAPSHAETIFKGLKASVGGDLNYEMAQGGRTDAHLYAEAMGLARVRYALIRAGNQNNADYVDELIEDREREYGLIPNENDTLPERRRAIKAAQKLPLGAFRGNVIAALSTLLGDDFINLRQTAPAERWIYPTAIGDDPMSLVPPETVTKVVTITQPISINLGVSQSVTYSQVGLPVASEISAVQQELQVGDQLVVNVEHWSLAEVVTVETVGVGTFTATFDRSHDINCMATTQPYPFWISNMRDSVVILTQDAARDPEKRRKVHELLGKILRGVSTWAIAEEISPGVAGPYTVGVSGIGVTPVGTITY